MYIFIPFTEKIVCYYGSWSYYRHGNGKFEIENINPHLCTHLIYTFVGLNQDGSIAILDPYLDLSDNWGRGNIYIYLHCFVIRIVQYSFGRICYLIMLGTENDLAENMLFLI